MTEPVLSIEGLGVSVAGEAVLTDVSFAVAPGEIVGVVGESGSGKTMTTRALTGMLPFIGGRIDAGEVRFQGLDLVSLDEDGWRGVRGHRLALILQSSQSALDPLMTVRDQLVETVVALSGRDGAEDRAVELLESVRLAPTERLLKAYPHELSGGMRQRVMIALALAGDAELLIGDEATTALDVTIQGEILELLDRLRRERGLSILLITHDFSVVRGLADSVAVMYAGTSVETGPTSEILDAPDHPYTAALLAAQPRGVRRGEAIHGIPGAPPAPSAWPSGCRFAPRCRHSADVCAAQPTHLRPRGPSRQTACVRIDEIEEL